jgi:putative SOS response-associated peptidase YedK
MRRASIWRRRSRCRPLNSETKERTLDALRRGLVPHWAKDLKIGHKMVNARAETVATLPPFRDAFARRRYIIAL